MIAQHSSETNEAYTPRIIVDPARQVLGVIDFDPASSHVANEVVQAIVWHDHSTDGWRQQWHGNVFLNPPGGLFSISKQQQVPTNAKKGYPGGDLVSSAAAWWSRLVWEYEHGKVTAAIFVCFSMALLRNAQSPKVKAIAHPLDFPVCIPRERVQYDRLVYYYQGVEAEPTPVDDPTQGGWRRIPTTGAPADSMIVYLPDKLYPSGARERFAEVFQHLGKVIT